jgi:hypothetical protein
MVERTPKEGIKTSLFNVLGREEPKIHYVMRSSSFWDLTQPRSVVGYDVSEIPICPLFKS